MDNILRGAPLSHAPLFGLDPKFTPDRLPDPKRYLGVCTLEVKGAPLPQSPDTWPSREGTG